MVTPQRHKQAMEKINSLLNTRERCIKELEERLAKADFSTEEIEDALQTALRVNLVNEERYARSFIRGKTHLGWGRAKILLRLKQDRIPAHIIDACEDDFATPDQEYVMAMREVAKRSARSKDPFATYTRRLVSKGYSFELSKRVVRDYLTQESESMLTSM